LQLNPTTRHLNSREYKLILIKEHFKDKGEGVKKAVSIVKSLVEQQGGTFNSEVQGEETSKKVWYLDTKKCDLHENKNNGLLIRVKEDQEKSEYKVEIKVRKPDRNEAASYDLSSPQSNPKYKFKAEKYKFEQDIKTPFDSIYSVSSVFEYKQKPDLNSYEDILAIYPSLSLDVSDKKAKLVPVKDFEAKEFNPDLGEIVFANGKPAKTQLSIWYSPKDSSLPCIVEFDIDVKAEKPLNKNGDPFIEFPQSKIGKIDELYNKLQDKNIGIANLEPPKTKTEFAYGWNPNI
jgi:hypothetical protein